MVVNVEKVQVRLLHLAKAVTHILEKHDIPYSLAYGTLLGAVRHQGFIPWDCDFDLWLFDDSYEDAKQYLREELPSDMFLEDEKSEPNYFHAWAHVKDLYSEVKHSRFLHDDSYKHKGLALDLYRLWKVRDRDVEKFLNNENRRYIMRRRQLGLMSDAEYKTRLIKLEENERNADKGEAGSEEDVYALLNFYQCKKMYQRYVFPLKKLRFEDTEFYGINQAGCILTDLYGDYMKPIAPEKRDAAYDSVKLFEAES